ncbi:unnamed protein product [Effrenium voratum]|nr:unnamed protein product [Effrenium voratum]
MECGCCALPSLLKAHPELVSPATLCHPHKSLLLLWSADGRALRRLCDESGPGLRDLVPRLFREVSYVQFAEVLVPLVSDAKLGPKLSVMMGKLENGTMLEVLNTAPKGKLPIVLKAPIEALALVVSGVEHDHLQGLLTVLQEPDELLEDTLVPLLGMVEDPRRMALVVNQLDPRVLVCLLRGARAQQLAALLNALTEEDLAPSGHAAQLLQQLGAAPGLAEKKVVPLLDRAEPAKMVRLVQGIPAAKLLAVLESLDPEDVLRLLEQVNADFAVRLFNGPLDSVIATMAGRFANVMTDKHIAELVKHSTDTLQAGLATADDVLARGQQARGGEKSYKFGDLTRGLLSIGQEHLEKTKELMEQHSKPLQEGLQERLEKTKELMDQHSKPLQAGLEAWHKDMLLKTGVLQSELQEGLAQGRERLSSLSCGSDAAYKRGLEDEAVFQDEPPSAKSKTAGFGP